MNWVGNSCRRVGRARLRWSMADGCGWIETNQLSEQILKYLKPEITQQATATNIFADTNGTISVSAEGKYLTYQWKKNGVNLAGETNATLSITDANATQHDGNYSVVVSNDFGSVESGEFGVEISNCLSVDGSHWTQMHSSSQWMMESLLYGPGHGKV